MLRKTLLYAVTADNPSSVSPQAPGILFFFIIRLAPFFLSPGSVTIKMIIKQSSEFVN